MKKFATMMILVVFLTMSFIAKAEVRVTGYSSQGPVDEDGVYRPNKWFVSYQLDHGEGEFTIEVSHDDYVKIVKAYESELELEKLEKENRWYNKATKWVCDAGRNVGDWVTFWN